ncbi:hypothetical protein [Caenispirillum bisanense]|uniref:hypothetical protein n=1 Tax=Caenispirillum bisanense TaxID=414052 RepID=UPI0031D9FC44
METGLLLLALGATVYVMHWLVTNDGVPRIADQTGLTRMKPPPGEQPSEPTADATLAGGLRRAAAARRDAAERRRDDAASR